MGPSLRIAVWYGQSLKYGFRKTVIEDHFYIIKCQTKEDSLVGDSKRSSTFEILLKT